MPKKILYEPWVVTSVHPSLPQVWTASINDSARRGDAACITDRVFNHTENAIASIPDMISVLREFVADVEAIAPSGRIEEDWPDILETYNRAKKALAKAEK